jgi:DNA-binding NarL/FixJ family response regulator
VLENFRQPFADRLPGAAIAHNIFTLMLCGYSDADLLEEALEAGASGFILKTSTPRQITDAVRQALEGATPLDQGLATGGCFCAL